MKDELIRLEKYLGSLTDRLTTKIPDKHINNPNTYKAFLQNEIRLVKLKLDKIKAN